MTRFSERKTLERENIRWLFNASRPWHGQILLLCLVSAVRTLLGLRCAVYMKTVIDYAVSMMWDEFVRSALCLLLLVIADVLLSSFFWYTTDRVYFRLKQGLQKRLYETLVSKNYTYFRTKHTGEWVDRLVSDVQIVSRGIAHLVPEFIGILVQFVGTVILLVKVSVWFLPVMLLSLLAYVLVTLILRKSLQQRQRNVRDAQGATRVFYTETLSKMLIVKAFNREENTVEEAEDLLEKEFRKEWHRNILSICKNTLQNAGTKLSYILVLIFGAYFILKGRISFGSLTMCTRLLSQIREPINLFVSYINNIFDYTVSAERLREAEDYPDDPACPVKSDREIHEWYRDRFREIVFDDVSFSYGESEDGTPEKSPKIFTGVDLRIPRQSVMAFTGATGSGKTTIFKLLMSLYSLNEGTIKLLTNDGMEYPLDASFRRLFAYVPQGNQLMAGTVREIVTFGDKTQIHNDEAIRNALEIACALDFVEKLPKGLDTEIREKGFDLSEGEMQRLAIARALFTERPVLLLDEATSSLDEGTERELLEHLKSMTDRTILIVTHRPAALSICDRELHIEGENITTRIIA